jgi:hypothetical protein
MIGSVRAEGKTGLRLGIDLGGTKIAGRRWPATAWW